jgi:MGT family glycosyltransferase
MATIAVLVDFEEGHFLSSVKLAKGLRGRGHRVVYLGPEAIAPMVERQGFELLPVFGQLLSGVSRSADVREPTAAWLGQLVSGEALDELLGRLRPDLMIVLSLFYPEALAVSCRYGLPIVLWTPFCRKAEVPRLTLVEDWVSNRLMSLRSSDLDAYLQMVAAAGHRFSSFKDMAQIILRMPELIAMPRAFELPEMLDEPNTHFCGTGIDLERSDEAFPWHELPALAARPDLPVVFCSLGSQADLEPAAAQRFFQTVAATAAANPSWQLILAVGRAFDPGTLGPLPANLHAGRWVPQLDVLRRARLMVTHAGAGTVKECILLGVPMVVLPLMRDQFDAARRVVHHRLGISGSLAELTPERLTAMIGEVVADEAMRQRVAAMQQLFLAADRAMTEVDVVEAALVRAPVPAAAPPGAGR